MVEAVKKMHASVSRSWARQTWKREVAMLLLSLIWSPSTLYLLMVAPETRMTAAGGIYGVMTAFVYTFALGAFGLDYLNKQHPDTSRIVPPPPIPGVPR